MFDKINSMQVRGIRVMMEGKDESSPLYAYATSDCSANDPTSWHVLSAFSKKNAVAQTSCHISCTYNLSVTPIQVPSAIAVVSQSDGPTTCKFFHNQE